MVEFDIFYRYPKKCFIPLRVSLLDRRKIEIIRDKRYKKGKFKIQQGILSLLRRKHEHANEEENDKQLEI